MTGSMLFEIPEKYRSQLVYQPCTDARSDAEILSTLERHEPVASEKNVWAYWHSGVANMPTWCQRNVASWVRMNAPSWTIRVLNNVPSSPNYALKWIPEEYFPECFLQGTMDGPFVGQHSSDFVRGAALYLYGGVWLDVGCIMFMTLDYICWDAISDPTTPSCAAAPLIADGIISNSFVASRKGDRFIKAWHDLFTSIWRGRTNYKGLLEHPVFAHKQTQDLRLGFGDLFDSAFSVSPQTVFEYGAQVFCWQLLAQSDDETDGFCPGEYWRERILKLQVPKEIWGMQEFTPQTSPDELLELLATPLDTDPTSDRYRKAEEVVFRWLTESCMEKVGHGKGLTKIEALGVLLEHEHNRDKDCRRGTFAEWLRYGAENFVQTRKSPTYVVVEKPVTDPERGVKGSVK